MKNQKHSLETKMNGKKIKIIKVNQSALSGGLNREFKMEITSSSHFSITTPVHVETIESDKEFIMIETNPLLGHFL